MRLGRRTTAALVLICGAALAILVISPALGGPSLKKLVKREVRKQVKKNPGPQGPQGVQGVQGAQGVPGPTFAASSTSLTPPATPENSFLTHELSFTTPAAGRLFITVDSDGLSVTCTPDVNADGELGVYVDGVAVPGTERPFDANIFRDYHVSGVTTGSFAAGAHTASVGTTCDGANTPIGHGVEVEPVVSVILVGS